MQDSHRHSCVAVCSCEVRVCSSPGGTAPAGGCLCTWGLVAADCDSRRAVASGRREGEVAAEAAILGTAPDTCASAIPPTLPACCMAARSPIGSAAAGASAASPSAGGCQAKGLCAVAVLAAAGVLAGVGPCWEAAPYAAAALLRWAT